MSFCSVCAKLYCTKTYSSTKDNSEGSIHDQYRNDLKKNTRILSKNKEVKTKTFDNLNLVGWLVYGVENVKNKTLLYFHENAGSKLFFIINITNIINI